MISAARVLALLFISAPFCATVSAQTTQRPRTIPNRVRKYYLDDPRTRLEEIQERVDEVVIKGFMPIGTISGRNGSADIEAVELRTTTNPIRATGIAVQLTQSQPALEIQSFIDYEEIQPLIRGLDAVAKVSDATTKMPNFSATYRTRDDFGIIVFRQTRSGIAVRLEGSAINATGGIDRTTIFITLDELNRLRGMIVEARQRLDEMR